MIFVNTNVFMYAVGRSHPVHSHNALVGLPRIEVFGENLGTAGPLGRRNNQGVPVIDAIEPVYPGRTANQSQVYLHHRQRTEEVNHSLRFLGRQWDGYA